jgi:hypothetical protein
MIVLLTLLACQPGDRRNSLSGSQFGAEESASCWLRSSEPVDVSLLPVFTTWVGEADVGASQEQAELTIEALSAFERRLSPESGESLVGKTLGGCTDHILVEIQGTLSLSDASAELSDGLLEIREDILLEAMLSNDLGLPEAALPLELSGIFDDTHGSAQLWSADGAEAATIELTPEP